MRNFVFGYGSLVNLASAAKTLGRDIERADVQVVEATSYARVWRVVAPVIIPAYSEEPVPAVFLDIVEEHGSRVNGIILEVSAEELAAFDIREKQYTRIDITPYIRPRVENARVFAYQGKPEFFAVGFSNPKVLKDYVELVEAGMRSWGEEFSARFRAGTRPHTLDVIEGEYKFQSQEQSRATGRY